MPTGRDKCCPKYVNGFGICPSQLRIRLRISAPEHRPGSEPACRVAEGFPCDPLHEFARAGDVDRPRRVGGVDQATFERTVGALTAADPDLARLVEHHGAPTLWLRPQGFPSLVLFILEQQVSLASAAAAYGKVLDRIGTMTPQGLLATTAEQLRQDGVSRQKDRYLRALAESVTTGVLELESLAVLDDDTVRSALTALPGIGRWTADVYLLACLGRPDLWPVGDRALQVAAAEALGLAAVPDPTALEVLGERWRPYRSTAARLLWHGYLARRGRVETPLTVLDGTQSPRVGWGDTVSPGATSDGAAPAGVTG